MLHPEHRAELLHVGPWQGRVDMSGSGGTFVPLIYVHLSQYMHLSLPTACRVLSWVELMGTHEPAWHEFNAPVRCIGQVCSAGALNQPCGLL